MSDNEEADNSQRQTESTDQVPDYTDDQDSSFNPKPTDLKSLDGSEVITDEDIHQEDNFNPSEDSDVPTDFDGVILTSVPTNISKKLGLSSKTKTKCQQPSSKTTV